MCGQHADVTTGLINALHCRWLPGVAGVVRGSRSRAEQRCPRPPPALGTSVRRAAGPPEPRGSRPGPGLFLGDALNRGRREGEPGASRGPSAPVCDRRDVRSGRGPFPAVARDAQTRCTTRTAWRSSSSRSRLRGGSRGGEGSWRPRVGLRRSLCARDAAATQFRACRSPGSRGAPSAREDGHGRQRRSRTRTGASTRPILRAAGLGAAHGARVKQLGHRAPCRNRRSGYPCPRGRGKATRVTTPCPGKIVKSHPIIPTKKDVPAPAPAPTPAPAPARAPSPAPSKQPPQPPKPATFQIRSGSGEVKEIPGNKKLSATPTPAAAKVVRSAKEDKDALARAQLEAAKAAARAARAELGLPPSGGASSSAHAPATSRPASTASSARTAWGAGSQVRPYSGADVPPIRNALGNPTPRPSPALFAGQWQGRREAGGPPQRMGAAESVSDGRLRLRLRGRQGDGCCDPTSARGPSRGFGPDASPPRRVYAG